MAGAVVASAAPSLGPDERGIAGMGMLEMHLRDLDGITLVQGFVMC